MQNENANLTIDKQTGDLAFNEESHEYFNVKDPTKKYTSVTTLVHKFTQPFDKDFWSAYKALEKIIDPKLWSTAKQELLEHHTVPANFLKAWDVDHRRFNARQQEILDMWKQGNLDSTQRGSKIHAELENSFYRQGSDISLQKFGIGGKFSCTRDNQEFTEEDRIYPEYMIYYHSPDNTFNIAGQIDLLVKKGNMFSIVDWKTNKEIKTKSYFDKKTNTSEKMKYPLNDLDDCNFNQYVMQVSTYAWMIQQQHPNWELGELQIIHFDHNNKFTPYKVDYLKDHVEKMLAYWRKQFVLDAHKAKNKKIEY